MENGWIPIGGHLVEVIESFFSCQDIFLYEPGRIVAIEGMTIDMRMVLISPGKVDPYKVFYRLEENQIQIYLVRHPHQKSLL
ncbi:hypothetical protein FITA111629_11880 [Filibacter tadaridae]|uniref:Uncharacterized protein n=1 Tax=Filibacter tadaridae TaxID=2483811 RepID=A0A3P5WZS4_9BACL|nr:hypothetical protein [Filibacter tadaridae]VDC21099.1 hypothetical protein FILTAD_00573 [Filibacter tadaridae]